MREHGSLEGCDAGARLTNDELLELECDVLVLAAREDQITQRERAAHSCADDRRGRERPDLARGRRDPRERGIPVLPDILTNAGGVTVSYFEWVQDLGRLFWTRDEIRAKLAEKLSDAFDRVWDLAEARRSSFAQARSWRGSARCRTHWRRGGSFRDVSAVRDAMVSHPGQLPADASRRRPASSCRTEVRAVFVTEDEQLVGVVTRKTLVREVVAKGLDPRDRLRDIAEPPHHTIGPDVPLEDAFRFLEAEDAERVPVVDEHHRLVGVLSRSVLQRRLAEDEEEEDDEEPLPPAA